MVRRACSDLEASLLAFSSCSTSQPTTALAVGRSLTAAAARSGSGRTVQMGFPSAQDSYLETEDDGVPDLEGHWRLGDDDLNDEDVYGPPVRQICWPRAGRCNPVYFASCQAYIVLCCTGMSPGWLPT